MVAHEGGPPLQDDVSLSCGYEPDFGEANGTECNRHAAMEDMGEIGVQLRMPWAWNVYEEVA